MGIFLKTPPLGTTINTKKPVKTKTKSFVNTPKHIEPKSTNTQHLKYLNDCRKRYEPIARDIAKKHGVPEEYFVRQIQQESAFDPQAKSKTGALGIAQIMPTTAKDWKVNPKDPIASMNAAAKNLSKYYKQFETWELAFAAYNAGPGNVRKYGNKIPPFKETENYVKKIMGKDK